MTFPPREPRRRLAVLTCMDARIDPARIFRLEPGDAHVLRNAGAIVTDDVVRSLELSRGLGVEEVAIVGHTDCAAVGAGVENVVRESVAAVARLGFAAVTPHVYDVATGTLRALD